MLYVNELFSYLADSTYKFLDRIEVSSDHKLTLLQFSELSKTKIHNPRNVSRTDSGTYVVKEKYYKFLEPQSPRSNNFRGNVYVLTGHKSFSAASLFATLVYAYKRGEIIGQETGGSASGLNGGDFIDLALSNTNLLIEIPIERWIKTIPDYPYKNRGVVPHHIVQKNIKDEITGIDTELEYTFKLIEDRRVAGQTREDEK